MSGSKRRSQYRKGVASQYLQGKNANGSGALKISAGDEFARIRANSGGGLFAAELADGSEVQAKLPNKFHKMIWIRPGDLVVLESEGAAAGAGPQGMREIRLILSKELIKELSHSNILPSFFQTESEGAKGGYDMDDIMPRAQSDAEEGDEEGVEEQEGDFVVDTNSKDQHSSATS